MAQKVSRPSPAQSSPGSVTSLQLSPLTSYNRSVRFLLRPSVSSSIFAAISHRYRQVKLSTNIHLSWRLLPRRLSARPRQRTATFTQSRLMCRGTPDLGLEDNLDSKRKKLQGREHKYRKKAHNTCIAYLCQG